MKCSLNDEMIDSYPFRSPVNEYSVKLKRQLYKPNRKCKKFLVSERKQWTTTGQWMCAAVECQNGTRLLPTDFGFFLPWFCLWPWLKVNPVADHVTYSNRLPFTFPNAKPVIIIHRVDCTAAFCRQRLTLTGWWSSMLIECTTVSLLIGMQCPVFGDWFHRYHWRRRA